MCAGTALGGSVTPSMNTVDTVHMECVNVAISVTSGLVSTFMGDCMAQAIPGPACNWADFVA